jgi:hypothetical protein
MNLVVGAGMYTESFDGDDQPIGGLKTFERPRSIQQLMSIGS